ncbi:MAG: protein-methionine-sulfoxide reductase heme-binding subunit MsrQ [Methylococcales bacterium]|nr:protein-methionine-sulfoxide reductase heme-binding subunit MsrQ [Methylococcales bacterium]
MPKLAQPRIRQLVFMLALLPMLQLIWALFTDNLGANPVEELSQHTGIWSLRFLLLTLACTPIRLLLHWPGIMAYRRMLGLYTFFYSSVHVFVYLLLEQNFTLHLILEDIRISWPIDLGLAAYLLLVPLFATSNQPMMRKLGRNWKKLHNSVHITAWLAILHFLFSEKADLREPLLYGGVLLALLVIKGWQKRQQHKRTGSKAAIQHTPNKS